MTPENRTGTLPEAPFEAARATRRVLVTGSHGLIGSALCDALAREGHEVTRLLRGEPRGRDAATWDPATGNLDLAGLAPDAVVHLAGENIAGGRWTAARMEAIRSSRVEGTRLLCEELARAPERPAVLVCASAVGFYGDRGDAWLDETSEPGRGFLADVCREWEAATEPARSAGIRVVNLRIGVVLAPDGGALAKMLTPFRLGVGGRLGSGNQYMSWIALDDVVGAIEQALRDETLDGPVNATAPLPVTNCEFTATLGRILRRPTIAAVPAPAARLAFGRMAEELLLASLRVRPQRLLAADYRFRQPELEGALRALLGSSS